MDGTFGQMMAQAGLSVIEKVLPTIAAFKCEGYSNGTFNLRGENISLSTLINLCEPLDYNVCSSEYAKDEYPQAIKLGSGEGSRMTEFTGRIWIGENKKPTITWKTDARGRDSFRHTCTDHFKKIYMNAHESNKPIIIELTFSIGVYWQGAEGFTL